MIGIYKITSPSGKVYIGQSWNIEKRFKTQYQYLHCKKQRRLYNSFVKYGVGNHIFEILEEWPDTITQAQLDERELSHCLQYDEKMLMNLRFGGAAGKLSEETKKRIGESNSKSITQFSKEGIIIKHWDSVKQCAIELGLHKDNISKCCRHQTPTVKGFIFRFGKYTENIPPYKRKSRSDKVFHYKGNKDPILQFGLDTVFINKPAKYLISSKTNK